MFQTPILFLVFNRINATEKVFQAIKAVQPKYLFIAADGPRKSKQDEKEKCEAVRSFILENIDWDCEVKTLFRENNLGCGLAVKEGIDWFFSHVEEGIILEDDCLPSHSFFRFCESMLSKFRNEKSIVEITGTNILGHRKKFGNSSYYFSSYGGIWGWATWRRAWDLYDFKLSNYQKDKNLVRKKIRKRKDYAHWMAAFDSVYNGQIDTWDYQWIFTIWKHGGICIVPNFNLITNIGFGEESTHTNSDDGTLSDLKLENIEGEILHTDEMKPNLEADNLMAQLYYHPKQTIARRFVNRILSLTK